MMCATSGAGLVAKGWTYELKLDGVRIVCDKSKNDVSLWYRTGRDTTGSYPEIARAVAGLPVSDAVLDGEIVAFGDHGKPSFQKLEQRIGLGRPRDVAAAAQAVPVAYVVFDLLFLGDEDLRDRPLSERRRLLRALVPDSGLVRCVDWVEDDGTALFDMCRRERLEGVIAKKASSKYLSGQRSPEWVKMKCQSDDDFVVVGFTRGSGGREDLGALDLATYEGTELVVRGKVGSGLDAKTMRALVQRLSAIAVDAPPAKGDLMPAPRGRTHVRPEVVVSVRYASWTDEGRVRHPVFRGVREDVLPDDCRATPPVATTSMGEELSDYWDAASSAILPYLRGRSAIKDATSLREAPLPLRLVADDWLVFDCDLRGALSLGALFREIGLPAFAKTGDAAEYHVVACVDGAPKDAVAVLGQLAAQLTTGGVARPIAGAIVAPYSPLGGAGSRVSTPLAWDELVPALDPRRLTTRTVPPRLAKRADPMAPLLSAQVDFAAAVVRLSARLSGKGGS